FAWFNGRQPVVQPPPQTAQRTAAVAAASETPRTQASGTVSDTRPTPVAPQPVQAAARSPMPLPSSAAPTRAPSGSLEDLVRRLLPAVVRVQTDTGYGTGFFVRPDTILTNVHVVQRNAFVTIRRMNGASAPARVDVTSPEVDIAVLRIDTPAPEQTTI